MHKRRRPDSSRAPSAAAARRTSTSWLARGVWLGLAILLATGEPAHGHDVNAEVAPGPTGFRVEFFFSDATPAADFAVTVTYADQSSRALGRTDSQGRVVFKPERRAACTVAASQAGHGHSVVIPLREIALVFDALHASAATSPSANATTQPTMNATAESDAFGPSRRAPIPFPVTEALASVLFVAVLSAVTFVLLRLAGRGGRGLPNDRDALMREIASLRDEVDRLSRKHDVP